MGVRHISYVLCNSYVLYMLYISYTQNYKVKIENARQRTITVKSVVLSVQMGENN